MVLSIIAHILSINKHLKKLSTKVAKTSWILSHGWIFQHSKDRRLQLRHGPPAALRARALGRAPVGQARKFRGHHLPSTTCQTQVFFKRDEPCSKSWSSLTPRHAHKTHVPAPRVGHPSGKRRGELYDNIYYYDCYYYYYYYY